MGTQQEFTREQFQKLILRGIPDILPESKPYENNINHAPKYYNSNLSTNPFLSWQAMDEERMLERSSLAGIA